VTSSTGARLGADRSAGCPPLRWIATACELPEEFPYGNQRSGARSFACNGFHLHLLRLFHEFFRLLPSLSTERWAATTSRQRIRSSNLDRSGLFRPHYVTWSEQRRIESHDPNYLANIVRIITETGLRIYKELMPMRKRM